MKKIKKICPKCGIEFETVIGKDEKKFCSRKCANSRIWNEEDKLKKSLSAKQSEKVKNENSSRKKNMIVKICPICQKEFTKYPCEEKRIYCSKKCYNKDSKLEFRKCGKGGCREGSGRSKSGWYKGYFCGSSYELAWVIYNIDHEIKFERNLEGFSYIFEGENHKYYPDFIKGDIYYEIKGFKRKNDDAKFKYFPHKLKVLFKKELGEIFKHVKETYGNDFIKLYEGNPYNEKKNKCKICGEPCKNMYCSQICTGIAVSKLKKKTS